MFPLHLAREAIWPLWTPSAVLFIVQVSPPNGKPCRPRWIRGCAGRIRGAVCTITFSPPWKRATLPDFWTVASQIPQYGNLGKKAPESLAVHGVCCFYRMVPRKNVGQSAVLFISRHRRRFSGACWGFRLSMKIVKPFGGRVYPNSNSVLAVSKAAVFRLA